MNLKVIENEIITIYENQDKEKLINARELHRALNVGKDFTSWIKGRIIKYGFIKDKDYLLTFTKIGERKNVVKHEYYLTIDMGKEISMIENNETGRKIRRYFIEVEKRYRQIIENPKNIFDFMRLALNQIEENENRINNVEKNIEEIKNKIDVNIKNEYCLASDIAEQLGLYSETKLPHSNLIGAIARLLGYKISYKHYYEDENIAIVPDLSKGNNYYQIYYKPKAVQEIINWFVNNKSNLEYKIIYERNSKFGIKGEIKERGYKIEDVCYKIHI